MKALSCKAPWAYMVIYGVPYMVAVDNPDGRSQRLEGSGKVIIKTIENRTWSLPVWLDLPQRIYIHVSKHEDHFTDELLDYCVKKVGLPIGSVMMMFSKELPRGAIIGEVTIVGQVTASDDPWFIGPYGFVLKDPLPYKTPITCRGQLGFWTPDVEITDAAKGL